MSNAQANMSDDFVESLQSLFSNTFHSAGMRSETELFTCVLEEVEEICTDADFYEAYKKLISIQDQQTMEHLRTLYHSRDLNFTKQIEKAVAQLWKQDYAQ
jgi:uncharacterized protein with ATP-grasp and redox domains